ncbi:MAG: SAVED domain-containing protein [Acidobacteria bacterium]|nr:MAG: SAVED domain-containing protein [Acidobacteriota bacterium]
MEKRGLLLQTYSNNHIFIYLESAGNLPPEKFASFAKEAVSALQEIKGKRYYERMHFSLSCPVAVAFCFGVAYGHYDRGHIYNYTKGYQRVLSLEFLREVIEGKA